MQDVNATLDLPLSKGIHNHSKSTNNSNKSNNKNNEYENSNNMRDNTFGPTASSFNKTSSNGGSNEVGEPEVLAPGEIDSLEMQRYLNPTQTHSWSLSRGGCGWTLMFPVPWCGCGRLTH